MSRYVDVRNKDKRWSKPIHTGFMNKYTITLGRKCWRRRYFILDQGGDLFYFKSEKKKEPCKDCVKVKGRGYWKSNVKKNCIEIERKTKPFLFYAKDIDDASKWVEMLGVAGGIFDANRVLGEVLPDICVIPVSSWGEEQIYTWLDQVPFDDCQRFSIYEDHFSGIDGPNLVRIRDVDLVEMGINVLRHRRAIRHSITVLRIEKYFNLNFNVVLVKIMSMIGGNTRSVRISQRRQLALNLSNPKSLRASYLALQDIRQLIEERKVFHEGVGVGDIGLMDEEESEGEVGDQVKGSILDFSKDCIVDADDNLNLGDFRKTMKDRYPVKLVVTEVTKKDSYKTARKLLSPIISSFGLLSQEFGIFHTALIIGPWYLEWNNSSLVIPRRATSSSAIIAADIKSSGVCNMKDEDMVKRLSEVICKWNTRKFYENMNLEKVESLGNCQHFVEDVLVSLGIQLTKTGCFHQFLKSMKSKGTCKMIFNPSKKLQELLKKKKMKEKSITFDTHRQLDKYVIKLRKVIGQLMGFDFLDEMKLLKSFDRAFWLRHFKDVKEKKYKPYWKRTEDGKAKIMSCPFDDPRKTRSYVTVE